MIHLETGSVIVPGELVAEGKEYKLGHGFYRVGENVYANRVGMLRISTNDNYLNLVPLTGVYNPREGDAIIGRVTDFLSAGWRVELNSPYNALLPLKEVPGFISARDMDKVFDINDLVYAKIVRITNNKLIDLSLNGPGLFKLSEGRVLDINPQKVPRVIGKRGSMISMIKEKTQCKIVVGKNGLIWIKGEPKNELIAHDAISMVEKYSNTSGLTSRVAEFLDDKLGIEPEEEEEEEEEDYEEESEEDTEEDENFDVDSEDEEDDD